MIIEKLTLKNFRCFVELDVSFDKKLNVFTGINGAGKTALLDALALSLSPILTHFPHVSGKSFRYEDLHENEEGRIAPYSRIHVVTADGLSWDRTEKRDKSESTAKAIPAGEGEKKLRERLDTHIDAINQEQPTTLPVFAYYGTNRALLEIPVRQRDFKIDFGRYASLWQALEPTSRFKTVFEWFLLAQFEEQNEQTKLRDFNYRSPTLQAVRRAVELSVPGLSNPRLETQPLHFKVTWRNPPNPKRELLIEQLSDGYRTMLALVMDFSRRLAQANPHLPNPLDAEAILIIDEIELHLHPGWQQRVVLALRHTFPNTQLILTTHSPQVLTTVRDGCVQIIDNLTLKECPAGTRGAEATRVLNSVFGIESRPPEDNDVPEVHWLRRYFDLIESNQWDSVEARELRKKLDAWSRGEEPALVRADLEIRRREWKRKKGQ